jgi:hypothetical protein
MSQINTGQGIQGFGRSPGFLTPLMVRQKKDLGGFTTGFSKGVTDLAAFGERLIGAASKPYVLHAVIVKKPVSIEELYKIHSDFVKDKKVKFIRETDSSYRIRIVPKTKFIKKSYRTKIISKEPHISLIFGKLI